MATDIGSTLRDARMRNKIDLGDIEADTKIRVRYLRALENEDWDVLPGGAYTRSFIRTYANYLGLDGERLADDYRRLVEDPLAAGYPRGEPPAPPAAGTQSRAPIGSRLQVSRGALAVLISVGLIVLLIGIGLAGGGDDGGGNGSPATAKQNKGGQQDQGGKRAVPDRATVRLTAIADVWVCLVNASQEPVIDGQILAAGAEEGPFKSKSFIVSFGNGQVEMNVNGKKVGVEDTPNPIGYEIHRGGKIRLLDEAERPTCT
jgi:cytoskeleton protein RodZ